MLISTLSYFWTLLLMICFAPPTPFLLPLLISALPLKTWALLQATQGPGPQIHSGLPWWRPCMLVLNGLVMLIELLWAHPRTLLGYVILWKTVPVWSLHKCRNMEIFKYLTIFYTVVKRIQSQDCHEGWKNYCNDPTQVLEMKGYWLRKNTC